MNTDIELNPKSTNILIVDDVQMNLLILNEILKKPGYTIRTFTDGYAALKDMEENVPDIILLDIMMPGIDGYEVCRRLKEDKKVCNIPVIFISALNDSQTIVKALGCGGVDYITKPFQPEEVTARVQTHLKLYQQSKELQALNENLFITQDQLKKFSLHLQTIREEEKKLLGTEIHDKIGQILVALKIDMGIWRKKVLYKLENNISNEILENFNELVNIVDNTISTAREITSNLKSDALEVLGFIETSKLYCAEFQSFNDINCSFNSSISRLELDEKQTTGLYKTLQDALSIVLKQSTTKFIKVTLSIIENVFVMEIEDDAKTIHNNTGISSESFGAMSMIERIRLLNGKLDIKTKENGATIIRVEMPYLGNQAVSNLTSITLFFI